MAVPSPPPPPVAVHNLAPRAYLAVASSRTYEQAWYLETRASHHLTFDHSNLLTSSKFEGPENVQIGNGIGVSIKHIGNSSLCSSNSNYAFSLHNLMHVPHITKNLISVSKFASDNNVYFEFFPEVCFVKSQVSKEVLLQGRLKDGLYKLDNVLILKNVLFHTALYSHCNLSNLKFLLWHRRLGRPASRTLLHVVLHCKIPLSSNKDSASTICNARCMGKLHQLPYIL